MTPKTKIRKFLICFLLIALSVPTELLFAQDFYPPDIKLIKDRNALVVALTEKDQPPFFYVDKKGELAGLDIDIAKSLAQGLGVRLRFDRSAKSFNDLIPNVASGRADVAISKLSRTSARAQMIGFTNPYITFHQALILNRLELAKKAPTNEDTIRFIKNFTGKIGVIANSSYVAYARKNFPSAVVVEYPSWNEVVDAVFKGEILAGYRDEMEIKKIIRSRSDASLKVKTVVLRDTRDDIAIAVAWQNTHLLYWLNLQLASMDLDLSADRLLDMYPDIFEE
ncbi:MAG TPA: ABC transporter substrate-binding protein [Spirochaetia bacterium]|nr:ABC transporter substrate-binding protein [Spirochaetia bacterium]